MDSSEARRLLGVGPDDGPDALRRAYRARARALHPDAGGSQFEMTRLNEAYRELRRPGDLRGEPVPPPSPTWQPVASRQHVAEHVPAAALRRAVVVLVGLCAVLVVVVFVFATGYDWSVGGQ